MLSTPFNWDTFVLDSLYRSSYAELTVFIYLYVLKSVVYYSRGPQPAGRLSNICGLPNNFIGGNAIIYILFQTNEYFPYYINLHTIRIEFCLSRDYFDVISRPTIKLLYTNLALFLSEKAGDSRITGSCVSLRSGVK